MTADGGTLPVRSAYRRMAFAMAGMTLAMAAANFFLFPGWLGERWMAAWSAWAAAACVVCGVALGLRQLCTVFADVLPGALACVVFTLSVLAFGGTPLYLVFMWGIFLGLGLLAARDRLPEAARLHGWLTLLGALAASVGSFFVTIDPTLLAVLLFAVVPASTAWRRAADAASAA